jgi:hypothetical protein
MGYRPICIRAAGLMVIASERGPVLAGLRLTRSNGSALARVNARKRRSCNRLPPLLFRRTGCGILIFVASGADAARIG